MKNSLIGFLISISLLSSGCFANNSSNPVPVTTSFSNGTYAGKFTSLHLHQKTGVTDTTVINLQLTITGANGFQITGDTTLHAASNGTYNIGANSYVLFTDKALPINAAGSKIHLNGIYLYNYTGTTLSLGTASAFDTLKYFYDFKKQ